MSMKTLTTKARSMGKLIQQTVVACAKDIADGLWIEYGHVYTDGTKDEWNTVLRDFSVGAGDGVASRTSEWKKFAEAVPYGMKEALVEYARTDNAPTLTRPCLWQLARAIEKASNVQTVKETVATFIKQKTTAPVSASPKSVQQKLGMAVGIIKKLDSRAKNIVAFRKDFAKLCREHGIAY
jgi:hypothetical protein